VTFKLRTLESLFEDYPLYQAICEGCRWGELFYDVEVRDIWCEVHICGTQKLGQEAQP
jgi:hypothetical protein